MFKLIDKKIVAILLKLFLLNWPYDIEGTAFSFYTNIVAKNFKAFQLSFSV